MASEAKWSDFASRDPVRTLAAANQLLPFWVGLILVVFLAWQLARIGWMLIPGSAAGDPVELPAGQVVRAQTAAGAADVNLIAAAHLFGEATEEAAEAELVVVDNTEDLEDTRLASLTLKGTIASALPEYSIAIIADGRNEESIYIIGDSVASNASLHAVHQDRVVLNEGGNLTNLRLPEEFTSAPGTTIRRANTTRRATPQRRNSIQSVVSQNVARLADVIRPTPYFVNGQQRGYRVYPGRDRRQFAALGLRPGDLITDIDGQALSDTTQAMQIFQSLGDASEVSVTVERDGNPEVIILRTSQLELGEQDQ